MSLKERLAEDLRAAMRSGDDVRKTTLRGLLSAIRSTEDALVKEKVPPEGGAVHAEEAAVSGKEAPAIERVTVELTDEDVEQVIRRQVKQR